MKPIATLANGVWCAANVPAWLRFRQALRRPAEAQRQKLRRLLSANAGSAYGRAHGFGEIRDYEEFRTRVPIVEYDDLEPWIARLARGEQSVLTCAPVTRLLPTSGSTGGRKLLPFTPSFQSELNAAIGPWIVDLFRAHPSLPFGPAYWSISPAIPPSAEETSAVPIGFEDDSAYLGGVKQRLAEATFAVPSVLRQISDIERFRYLTLLHLLREPELRLVSVWHPSFFALLLEMLPARWEELVQEVAKSSPHRARQLRHTDPAQPETIWPRLRVVSCWGDGQAALPMAELQRRLPRVAFQAKGLLATEAFVSIPFRGQHPLAVTSHFFEFENARGDLRLAHELRAGESYAIIVTTGGGLWRYRLGDFVEVDGFAGATPSLSFLGRGGSVSDLCGEKLAEAFVTRALEAACGSCNFAPRFAMLAPEADAGGRWSYTLFAEGEMPANLPVCLEHELRRNPHYALCRDLQQLGPLRGFPIASGGYETFCKVLAADGRRLGEIKPQSLSPRTDWRRHFARGSTSDSRVAGRPSDQATSAA